MAKHADTTDVLHLPRKCTEAVDMAVKALIHALQQARGLHLPDHVLAWFWDGRVEAMNVLKENFEGALGYLCIEHARRNAKKRYTGGYAQVVHNMVGDACLPA